MQEARFTSLDMPLSLPAMQLARLQSVKTAPSVRSALLGSITTMAGKAARPVLVGRPAMLAQMS